jgi:hypothetical protein
MTILRGSMDIPTPSKDGPDTVGVASGACVAAPGVGKGAISVVTTATGGRVSVGRGDGRVGSVAVADRSHASDTRKTIEANNKTSFHTAIENVLSKVHLPGYLIDHFVPFSR